MYGNDGWGWGAWLAMSIGMLALVAFLLWAVVMLTRGRSTAAGVTPAPSAEDVLARRLATGEIETSEYEERLAALRGSARPPLPS